MKDPTSHENENSKSKISVFDEPLCQAGYIFYLILNKKQIPDDLDWLLGAIQSEYHQQTGIPAFKINGDEIEIIFSEDSITKEGLEDIYPPDEYAKVKDYHKIQSGFGLQYPTIDFNQPAEKGMMVKFFNKKIQKDSYGTLEDIFDDGSCYVRSQGKLYTLELHLLKKANPKDIKVSVQQLSLIKNL